MNRPIIATVPISNLATFEAALDLTKRTLGPIFPYWRGHGNIDWSLTAEVFRTLSHGSQHPEVTLIRNFMGRAESRSHRCPAYDDYVGWLMLARHFYLPTRLLDWSMSPPCCVILRSRTPRRGRRRAVGATPRPSKSEHDRRSSYPDP